MGENIHEQKHPTTNGIGTTPFHTPGIVPPVLQPPPPTPPPPPPFITPPEVMLPGKMNGIPQNLGLSMPSMMGLNEQDKTMFSNVELLCHQYRQMGELLEAFTQSQIQLIQRLQNGEKLKEDLQAQRDSCMKEVSALKAETSELTRHYEEAVKQKCEENGAAIKQCAVTEKNAELLKKEIKNLQTQMFCQKSEMESQNSKLQSMQTRIGKLEQIELNLKQEIANLTEKLANTGTEGKKKEGEIERIKKAKVDLENQLSLVKKDFVNQNDNLQEQIDKQIVELKNLSTSKAQLQIDLNDIGKKFCEQEKVLAKVVEEKNALVTEIEAQKAEVKGHKDCIKNLESDKASLTKTVSNLSKELEEEQKLKIKIIEEELQYDRKRRQTALGQLVEQRMRIDTQIPLVTAVVTQETSPNDTCNKPAASKISNGSTNNKSNTPLQQNGGTEKRKISSSQKTSSKETKRNKDDFGAALQQNDKL